MEDHDDPLGLLGQDRQRLADRVAIGSLARPHVDYQRLADLPGDPDLRPERRQLILAGRSLPVEVEAGLADRSHRVVRRELAQPRLGVGVESRRGVRMPADAREDRVVRPRERDRPLVRLLVEPDREDPPDPGLPGPGDQVLRRVVAEAEVSVRIDHAGQCRSDYRSRRANAATARAITTPV